MENKNDSDGDEEEANKIRKGGKGEAWLSGWMANGGSKVHRAQHAVGVAADGRRGIENHADSTEAPSVSVSCPYPSSWVAVGVEAAVEGGGGGHGDAEGAGRDGGAVAVAAETGEEKVQPTSHPLPQSRSRCRRGPMMEGSMRGTKRSRWLM